MSITIETRGRRHYFMGNTYPARQKLLSAGCNWDSAARAWWTAKKDLAQELLGELSGEGNQGTSDAGTGAGELKDSDTISGRGRYKGRDYLVLWMGHTKRGHAAKLAFTDGSKVFWADASEVSVTKDYSGGRTPMTFGKLRRLRAEFADRDAAAKSVKLIGEKAPLMASVEVGKGGTPGEIGSSCWLRTGPLVLAVVLVGYETPTFVRGDDAEDMGHYGVRDGWYSTAYHRRATAEEFASLQSRDPRQDGTCAAVGEAVVAALRGLAAR